MGPVVPGVGGQRKEGQGYRDIIEKALKNGQRRGRPFPGVSGRRYINNPYSYGRIIADYSLCKLAKEHWYRQLFREMVADKREQYRLMIAQQRGLKIVPPGAPRKFAKMSTGKPSRYKPPRRIDRSYIPDVQDDDDSDDNQTWEFDYPRDSPKAWNIIEWEIERLRPQLEDHRKVKEFLDKGFVNGEPYYLVKWEGDPENSSGTWMLRDHFMKKNFTSFMEFDKKWNRDHAKKKVKPHEFPKEILDLFLKKN